MAKTDWFRLLGYVTGLVNQELLLKNEYLVAENRMLTQGDLPRRRSQAGIQLDRLPSLLIQSPGHGKGVPTLRSRQRHSRAGPRDAAAFQIWTLGDQPPA